MHFRNNPQSLFIKSSSLLLLAGFLLSGCAHPVEHLTSPSPVAASQPAPASAPAKNPSSPAAYTEKSLTRKVTGMDLKATYPQWPNAPEDNQRIQETVSGIVGNNEPSEGSVDTSIEIGYKVLTETPKLISIRFDGSFYSEGAAHPNSFSTALNLDRQTHKPLTLQELFKPDSHYLETLSKLCADRLKMKLTGDSFFEDGIKPVADNFRNWNLTKDGLLFTFDPYQVAPYAEGPQEVTIPYAELTGILKPEIPALAQ